MKHRCAITLVLACMCIVSAQAQIQVHIPKVKPIYSTDTLTLRFFGDVMMHKIQLDADHTYFLRYVTPLIREADVAVANMEFSLGGEPYTGYPCFSAPDYYAQYVADCGVDIFMMANNHILDRQSSGLLRTLDIYGRMADSCGIKYTGTGIEPLLFVRKGIRIALVNFTYDCNGFTSDYPRVNWMDKGQLDSIFVKAKQARPDFIIALPHWGEEFKLVHSAEQQQWAQWLIDQGADAIVGGHPHVVQDTTHIDGKPVIYSMGNFISNMSAKNTRLEMAVTIRIARDWNGKLTMLEPELEFMWCTLPGKLTTSYATIPVRDYIGRREEWIDPDDYDNVLITLKRVLEGTGIDYSLEGVQAPD